MGNTNSAPKRRYSIDDEYNSHVTISTNPYYPPKRKLFLQASRTVTDDDTVVSILTEGHTIDAIADQLRDSRIQDKPGKPTLYVGGPGVPTSNIEMSEDMSQAPLPTVFKWEGGGKEVFISGSFNDWRSKIPMVKSKQNFYTIIDLAEGEHQYKFIVDGQWKLDKGQPTALSINGVLNNTISVSLSDFDVINALTAMDAIPTGSSPPGEYNQVIPDSVDAVNTAIALSSSLTTSTNQPVSSLSVDAKKTTPPLLPPQLLQVILNRDTGINCDPSLLPQPNHVMLNHMYALSIKDGVIVLSAITRFRQKFVSTVLYKPI